MDKKARDTIILELKEITTIADYFVICSGDSSTQVKAIVENIDKKLRQRRQKPLSIEGLSAARWVLMDYGDVIVHVFEQEARSYYGLERLWLDAPKVSYEIQKTFSEKDS